MQSRFIKVNDRHYTKQDIGKSEMSSGCTFVALSRLKRLNDGIIQPMSLQSIAKATERKQRLQQLCDLTINSVC